MLDYYNKVYYVCMALFNELTHIQYNKSITYHSICTLHHFTNNSLLKVAQISQHCNLINHTIALSIASADAYLTPCIKDYINSFASGFLHKVRTYTSVSQSTTMALNILYHTTVYMYGNIPLHIYGTIGTLSTPEFV